MAAEAESHWTSCAGCGPGCRSSPAPSRPAPTVSSSPRTPRASKPEGVAALTAAALGVAVRLADATGQGDFRELLVRGEYGYVATYAAGRRRPDAARAGPRQRRPAAPGGPPVRRRASASWSTRGRRRTQNAESPAPAQPLRHCHAARPPSPPDTDAPRRTTPTAAGTTTES